MKRLLPFVIVVLSVLRVSAQEADTVPINTQDLNLKLKKNPLPSRTGSINFTPVNIKPVVVNAKVNYWKTRTNIGINLNQASFTGNWKGGGVNSIALGGLINYRAEYNKESYSYVSEVLLQYGKIKNRGQLEKKTNDRIFWDNKAALQLSKNWYFFGSLTFESQFDDGFSYKKNAAGEEVTDRRISTFMAPGYLTESIGFEYKPSKYFSTRIGTGTARQTFVLDTSIYAPNGLYYGIEKPKKVRNELAFQVVSNFEKEVIKNTVLKWRYQMFIPYEDLTLSKIDHRLDIGVTAKINRFMNTGLTGILLFDKDQDVKVQASQALALGFTFTFPR
ncbi:hypothetical protein C7T94_02550 [Pedobacter yulinensis]|uniref:DUF3078 domain-containing protein n=1 Tax=Pedobacter yulinensis TaxID=2126353 RepID=A0A2T3HRC8_9SPHI|nr:DUF3078 domain-containing protein [Pedobacter yulinensis]PST85014.1 hypothetical protein C7T94_02550 [Pedobacter yulinensis]